MSGCPTTTFIKIGKQFNPVKLEETPCNWCRATCACGKLIIKETKKPSSQSFSCKCWKFVPCRVPILVDGTEAGFNNHARFDAVKRFVDDVLSKYRTPQIHEKCGGCLFANRKEISSLLTSVFFAFVYEQGENFDITQFVICERDNCGRVDLSKDKCNRDDCEKIMCLCLYHVKKPDRKIFISNDLFDCVDTIRFLLENAITGNL